ncbi:uncharacterized protein LOC105210717 [Zeugodacus cucurbitae]|uniref:uncharacterized protein LOC105210717 n=1 Tax=Zeugodacus cucurbitae TaxID=28588 RepID=UPI0023D91958|nr:uncharacterized protein LOC105210717 [Zeugodacus cucurbitae]XP_028895172.2 uncharacterized protein LOC105210717 [Zeugodacus cucurbitae]
MGDYKQLNKELVDANRELKQTIAIYQKELVLIRAELMDQHRLRVETEREYRDRVLALLAQNFLTSVREIDANVNVPELIGFNNNTQTSNYTNGISAISDSRNSRRRSTHLVREFRRSSAVCGQNSIRMSPTRRPYEDHAIIEQTETSKLEESCDSDMDLENSIVQNNVIEVENEESYENADLHCIKEANEEEYEENMGDRMCTVVEKSNRQPIRDISNIDMEQVEHKGSYVTKRGKQRKGYNNNENSIQVARNVEDDDMELEDDLIHALNRSLHVSDKTTMDNNAARKPLDEECFKRQLVVKIKRLHEPEHAVVHFSAEDNTIIPEEHELSVENRRNNELSLGITQFSMGNFLEASCSTPCNSMKAAKEDATHDETSDASSYSFATSQCMRPSRRCAPTTLAEPNLRVKLRNDSGKRTKKR